MKGDITESEYLPFDLLLLELAAFQVAPHHPLIELLTEFAKKISTAVIFATLHIHIYVVAVLYLHSEDFREGVCQFLHTNFSITDTIAGVESIQEFDQICCPACLQRSFWAGLTGKAGRSPYIRIFNNSSSVSMTKSSSNTFFHCSIQSHLP